ncbi:hypothetical protein Taro_004464 [Colocasia esculenta]|uniref:Uncharacterized protein n=1 Tax=Colocasia esculenta TaxID=4460 RepID=A0A843TUZ1_COLES|nr:hypothetical protein [Colocasia esculenta]
MRVLVLSYLAGDSKATVCSMKGGRWTRRSRSTCSWSSPSSAVEAGAGDSDSGVSDSAGRGFAIATATSLQLLLMSSSDNVVDHGKQAAEEEEIACESRSAEPTKGDPNRFHGPEV